MIEKMSNIKFTEEEKSRANKIFIVVEFAGGDADTEHDQEYELSFPFDKWEDHIDEIKEEYDKWYILHTILDANRGDNWDYDKVEKKYGEEIAMMYDNTPNDPQCDYQFKCYLDDVHLIGYDKEGTKFKSYL